MAHLRFCIMLMLFAFLYPMVASSPFFRLQHRYGGSRNKGTMEHLKALLVHDKARHRRILTSATELPLGGSGDPTVAGLYYTQLQIGTPPSTYYVQVDTGSDLLWVNCVTCATCATSSDLGVPLLLYAPDKSASSRTIKCGDSLCSISPSTPCSGQGCGYKVTYGDGSQSSGYLIEDTLQLNLLSGNGSMNASIVFGCGTTQAGNLQERDQALDGILGFGQSEKSVIQQLMSQGAASGVFAHCLEGQGVGGGILVIGDVQVPGIVYTSIVPNQSHYNVDLKAISFENTNFSINISPSSSGVVTETIIDSGTTLAYFVDSEYVELIQTIIASASTSIVVQQQSGLTCVIYSGSLDDIFPTIIFEFDGASMSVKPHDYFFQLQASRPKVACIGFQSSTLGVTILGDVVLQDKLFVYNLDEQKIGWVDYDCSTSVSVNSSGHIERAASSTVVQTSGSSLLNQLKLEKISFSVIICLICILMVLLQSNTSSLI